MSRDYELSFAAQDGGVMLTLTVGDDVADFTGTAKGLRIELLMSGPDAKLATEMLLAAYDAAFHRFPHGVPITHKKEG